MPLVDKPSSEFACKVVRIGELKKHPNADKLEIAEVDGFAIVTRLGDFKTGERALYVSIDAEVPTVLPEFAFLHKGSGRHRVRASRLRGVFSCGLLVPARPEWKEGANMADELGVTKWLSPDELREQKLEWGKRQVAARRGVKAVWMPTYSLDSLRRYSNVLQPGEPVSITEKIHGTNARFVYKGGRLWVGTHKTIRGCSRHRLSEWFERLHLKIKTALGMTHRAHALAAVGDVWWECAQQYGLKEKLKEIPGIVCFGEIYGEGVQDLVYDSPKGRRFRVFDFFSIAEGRYLDVHECWTLAQRLGLPSAPEVYAGPWQGYDPRGYSLLNATQLREGVVVKPLVERTDPQVGRVALKLVSEDYLLRK
jgi:RNA ligase (TIGR02306 family)